MTATRDEHLFGRLALHYRLLSRDQLAEALQQQEREGHRRKLGEILIDRGWITLERFEQVRRVQEEYQAKLATRQSPGDAEPPQLAPASGQGGAAPLAAPLEEATASGAASATQGEVLLANPSSTLPPLTAGEFPDPAAVGLGGPPERPQGELAPTDGWETRGEGLPAAPEPAPPPRTAWLEAPDTHTMQRLLGLAQERGASDLHIHAGLPVRLRIHGDFQSISHCPLAADDTVRLVGEILTREQSSDLETTGQVDFAYTLPEGGRFRANVYRQQNGTDGVFRVIPAEPPSLSQLGLPLELARLANFHQGLVLITGPTGCGKSSTLAALVRIVNEERRDHIITIEDPIEFVHRPRRCVVNQRQVGNHTQSFSRALRAALREDPDVIVVGELRDLETISLALTAAETGHLVLATLHTMNAINTINRLVGVFPPAQQAQIRTMVSESLRAVTSQRLVRRADGAGRVPAVEVMIANKAVGNLIRESKTFQIRSVLQTGASQGMRSLDGSLEQLVEAGVVAAAEARRHAEDVKKFPG